MKNDIAQTLKLRELASTIHIIAKSHEGSDDPRARLGMMAEIAKKAAELSEFASECERADRNEPEVLSVAQLRAILDQVPDDTTIMVGWQTVAAIVESGPYLSIQRTADAFDTDPVDAVLYLRDEFSSEVADDD